MKKIFLTLLITFNGVLCVFAQAPPAFKCQAEIRDNSGGIIAGQLVSIRIGIVQDSINGTLIYQETHSIPTNQFGITNFEIGRGTTDNDTFEDINWGTTSHFLILELDQTGDTNYQLIGTPQLLSVPYALNSSSLTLTSPNGRHYEVTVDNNGNFVTNCNPMPSVANAGSDQNSICIPATLSANTPQNGNGVWSIVNGTGGSIADTTDPGSLFSGIAGNTYTLRWTITNICGFSEDDVIISFLASPVISNAGPDQLNIFSPAILAANNPGSGTGTWTILNGTGGSISDPNDPSSLFLGTADSSYTLRWTISTICDTTTNEVNIGFDNCPSTVSDTEGNIYNTIVIGSQCWMSENLNIGTMIFSNNSQNNNGVIEKYCYQNNISNCDVYGGLYQWREMMQYISVGGAQGICPSGWHLPTDAEWCTLEQEVDTTIICNLNGLRGVDGGSKLKETGNSHWNGNNGTTNSSGFTALPGGFRSGSFGGLMDFAYFWSSTENGSNAINRRLDYNNEQVYRNSNNKNNGFSVRCIKD